MFLTTRPPTLVEWALIFYAVVMISAIIAIINSF